PTPVAPFREQDPLPRREEVRDRLAGLRVADDRTQRKRHDDVPARAAVAVRSHSVLAPLGAKALLVAQVVERVQRWIGDREDRAAVASISPGRASAGNEFLTAKGDAPVAAVPPANVNFGGVDEHGRGTGRRETESDPSARIFFLKTRTFRLRTSPRTVALTETPDRSSFADRMSPSAESSSTSERVISSPFPTFFADGFSMRTTSPAETFNCLPPERRMAYMEPPERNGESYGFAGQSQGSSSIV